MSNPASLVSPAKRMATCQKCHPGVTANLLSFDPHADHRDPKRSPELYWTYIGLLVFICSVFGVFGIHSIFWFVRGLIETLKHGRSEQLHAAETAYIRFQPFHRIAHTVMVISFLGLALTGLPLKFSQYEWARRLANYLGGFDSTGLWHRLFLDHNVRVLLRVHRVAPAKLLFGAQTGSDARRYSVWSRFALAKLPRPAGLYRDDSLVRRTRT